MGKRLLLTAFVVLFITGCAASAPLQEEVLRGGRVEGGEVGSPSFDASREGEKGSILSSYGDEQADSQAIDIERMVIKNANLSIVVENPSDTMDDISQMASEMGGYVVSSNLSQVRTERGVEVPQARITIRVPSEGLDQALQAIKQGAGRVLSENISGEDVTKEYTDLESRLRHLKNAEKQLTRIMEQAAETEDVLSVYNRLVEVQEEIEQVKGQMQYYEQSAALSAISVTIQANEAVQPLQIGGWQPVGVAKKALQALINTLQFFGDAAIWVGLFVLPVALILFFVFYFLWKGVKRAFRSFRSDEEESSDKGE